MGKVFWLTHTPLLFVSNPLGGLDRGEYAIENRTEMGFDKNQVVRLVIAVGYPAADDVIRKKVRKESSKVIEIHK